jgi:hypothetical protein
MGSSNFLQFNPSAANQQTDAQYLTDATRVGGAGVDAEWPSPSANKTLYQGSTGVTALMQMMANKGFAVSDADIAVLTGVLANILTTADIQGALQSVAYSPSLALNAAAYSGFQISLTGNTTLTISGQTVGQIIVLLFVQDATGGHTVTFPSNIIGASQPDPTASVITAQAFKTNAALTLEPMGPAMSVNGVVNTPIGAAGSSTGAFSALTCPTRSTGDSTTHAATTAFVQAAVAASFTNGSAGGAFWQKDPNGKITQWANNATATSSGTFIAFPVAFTNGASVNVQCTIIGGSGDVGSLNIDTSSISTTGFTVFINNQSSASITWLATGY